MSENSNLESRIREVEEEIEAYRQALEDAQGALADAERELDEMLAEYENGNNAGIAGDCVSMRWKEDGRC